MSYYCKKCKSYNHKLSFCLPCLLNKKKKTTTEKVFTVFYHTCVAILVGLILWILVKEIFPSD
jgi:hypothetical protein